MPKDEFKREVEVPFERDDVRAVRNSLAQFARRDAPFGYDDHAAL